MLRISKTEYTKLKSKNPKLVTRTKRSYWQIEQSTYNPYNKN